MIVVTMPIHSMRKGRPVPCAQLLSTVPGRDGRHELLQFAKRLGMPEAWLRNRQSAFEHFELYGDRITRAVDAGASRADGLRLQFIIRRKRELLGEVPSRNVGRIRRALAIVAARAAESKQSAESPTERPH